MLTEIERAAIDEHRRSLDVAPPTGAGSDDVTVYLGIRLLLEAGRLVRERRAKTGQAGVTIKEDGSPATEIERQIESRLRRWLSALDSDAVLVGEETGGILPLTGTAIAIDPIDGTRAFLAETETYSTTLALIRDGEVILGMVSNPTAGEIAYASARAASRLIRLSTFGEPDEVSVLKRPSTPERPLLVNIHPSQSGADVVGALYHAWEQRDIAMVRSPGGSPAWALVESARGHFVYANLWSKRAAEAFDLAAGTLIVRQAGGEVSDLDGEPIDALRHRGPFVAGMDPPMVSQVIELMRGSLGDSETK